MSYLKITKNQYKDALETLAEIALTQNSTASEAAAEIVLSLNNMGDWKLDLCKLDSLDAINYSAAIDCIDGKRRFKTEPQYILNNADEILAKMKKRYKHLKIKKR